MICSEFFSSALSMARLHAAREGPAVPDPKILHQSVIASEVGVGCCRRIVFATGLTSSSVRSITGAGAGLHGLVDSLLSTTKCTIKVSYEF